MGIFVLCEKIARLREARHPAAIFKPRIPADMIHVQMRTHNEINIANAKPKRGQVAHIGFALHLVPEGMRRAVLVIADAGINQDIVMRRAHHPGLDAKHQLARLRVQRLGLQPISIFGQQFRRQVREEGQRIEDRSFFLHNPLNREIAKLKTFIHGLSPLRISVSIARLAGVDSPTVG